MRGLAAALLIVVAPVSCTMPEFTFDAPHDQDAIDACEAWADEVQTKQLICHFDLVKVMHARALLDAQCAKVLFIDPRGSPTPAECVAEVWAYPCDCTNCKSFCAAFVVGP
jgi:hypothetical protein